MTEKLNVLGIVLIINAVIVLIYWICTIPFRKGDRKACRHDANPRAA